MFCISCLYCVYFNVSNAIFGFVGNALKTAVDGIKADNSCPADETSPLLGEHTPQNATIQTWVLDW